jgi:hypothetical protein
MSDQVGCPPWPYQGHRKQCEDCAFHTLCAATSVEEVIKQREER